MARAQYGTNPTQKLMEVFSGFQGGMNPAIADDLMSDGEHRRIVNMDFYERGTIGRRKGHKFIRTYDGDKIQGMANYGTLSFSAIDGKVYCNGTLLPTPQFQSSRTIDMLVYKDELYIATGSHGIYTADLKGKTPEQITVSELEQYRPTTLEMLYIGTNAYSADPENWFKNEEGSVDSIDGVTFSKRYNEVGASVKLSSAYRYVNAGESWTWELSYVRPSTVDKTAYVVAETKTITTGSPVEFWFRQMDVGDYTFRLAFKKASAAEYDYDIDSFVVPKYTAKAVLDARDTEPFMNYEQLRKCNRMVIYNNRVFMYGSPDLPSRLLWSHINNFGFFPNNNWADIQAHRTRPITNVTPYRDSLIIFTDGSIHMLKGRTNSEFTLADINTAVGCIAPRGVAAMGNYLAFVWQDGIYILQTMYATPDQLNIKRIDNQLAGMNTSNVDTMLVQYKGQLIVANPSDERIFRYYFQLGGVWVMDEGLHTAVRFMYTDEDGTLIGLTSRGIECEMYNGEWSDMSEAGDLSYEDVYNAKFESRDITFAQPYHRKKLKRLYLTAERKTNINFYVSVFADGEQILEPFGGHAVVENGEVVWKVKNAQDGIEDQPIGTRFGEWEFGRSPFGDGGITFHKLPISGKCRKARLLIEHKDAKPFKLINFGFLFKMKKP